MGAKELEELFGLSKRLKVIHLDAGIIPEAKFEGNNRGAAYIRSLASRCRSSASLRRSIFEVWIPADS